MSNPSAASASASANNGEPVRSRNVTTRAVPEHDAVAAAESKPDFSVLVGIKAPPLSPDAPRHSQCAPINLVAVLDVSGSMQGPKLELLKRAVHFVIDNLGPSDRLSIVSFNGAANLILPLVAMSTEQSRAHAKVTVNSMFSGGNTNILEGLKSGASVLDGRTGPIPAVASMMLLSDGNDSFGLHNKLPAQYLPATINAAAGDDKKRKPKKRKPVVPVHTFGFGSDHNPLLMHAIADSSGGTFSFIESYPTVQAAFARCIGGLLSVVTQDLRLSLRSASQGVDIKAIPSGRHVSEITDNGSRGAILVGDLYADEEKEFLINVTVPVYTSQFGEDEGITSLLDITCTHKDAFGNETVLIDFVEIRRPGVPLPEDVKVKIEVDRQKNRLEAAEGFAEAQRAAEAGDLKGARAILSKKRSALLASEAGQAGDLMIVKVEKEMKETEERMWSKQTYEKAGRAYALSNISAHANQRATTSNAGGSRDDAYVTPNMVDMVNKSIVKIEQGVEAGTKRPKKK